MLNFYPILEPFGDLVVIILQRGKFCPHEKNENEMLKNEQKNDTFSSYMQTMGKYTPL